MPQDVRLVEQQRDDATMVAVDLRGSSGHAALMHLHFQDARLVEQQRDDATMVAVDLRGSSGHAALMHLHFARPFHVESLFLTNV